MEQDVASKLIKKAKFVVYAWSELQNIKCLREWYWLIPIEEIVIVVKECVGYGERRFEMSSWSKERLENLLNTYFKVGSRFYEEFGMYVYKIQAVVENWSKSELKRAKEWWDSWRVFYQYTDVQDKPSNFDRVKKIYFDGIKRGYYLVPKP